MMHTPAPWSSNKEGSIVYGPPHRHPQSTRLGVEMRSEPVVCFVRGYTGSDEALANARLIAAAPELLAAAKLMFEVINRERWYTPQQRENFAAIIAKAEGR